MAEMAAQQLKAEIVEELRQKLLGSKVVGLARVSGIPAPQMQSIRSRLRGKVELRVVKNRLLLRALEAASKERKGIVGLEELVEDQMALVLTDTNPFRLFKELEGTKTRAPAKGGEVAPEDIVVREGDTPFKPGPVVGDLQKAGIPAAIERGKVVIKKDKVLVPSGERIPVGVAKAITRLDIFPLIVGLDLQGVVEEDSLFTRDVLAVDEAALWQDMITAARNALTLALEAAFPTKATVSILLGEAQKRAASLGLATGYPERELLPFLLTKAHRQMLALTTRVPEEVDDDVNRGAIASPQQGEATRAEPPSEEARKNDDDEEEAAEGHS